MCVYLLGNTMCMYLLECNYLDVFAWIYPFACVRYCLYSTQQHTTPSYATLVKNFSTAFSYPANAAPLLRGSVDSIFALTTVHDEPMSNTLASPSVMSTAARSAAAAGLQASCTSCISNTSQHSYWCGVWGVLLMGWVDGYERGFCGGARYGGCAPASYSVHTIYVPIRMGCTH